MHDKYGNLIETIRELTGNNIEEAKSYLVESRLREVLNDYRLRDFDEIAKKIKDNDDPEFTEKVIERITTHETRFFRDESIFEALTQQIIPEWLDRRRSSSNLLRSSGLRIWSAASSTGQEPYSIRMMLLEKMPEIAERTTILATDISRGVLDRAESGIYSKYEIARGLPSGLLRAYFTARSDGWYEINETVKRNITFQKHNLISDPYPGPFDIIFCRNVAIYFDGPTRKKIYSNLKQSLHDDGFMVPGSAESLMKCIDNYNIRRFKSGRYYQFFPPQSPIPV